MPYYHLPYYYYYYALSSLSLLSLPLSTLSIFLTQVVVATNSQPLHKLLMNYFLAHTNFENNLINKLFIPLNSLPNCTNFVIFLTLTFSRLV